MKRKLFVATIFATAGYLAVQSMRKRNNLPNVAPESILPVKIESKSSPEVDLTDNMTKSEVDDLTNELAGLLDL